MSEIIDSDTYEKYKRQAIIHKSKYEKKLHEYEKNLDAYNQLYTKIKLYEKNKSNKEKEQIRLAKKTEQQEKKQIKIEQFNNSIENHESSLNQIYIEMQKIEEKLKELYNENKRGDIAPNKYKLQCDSFIKEWKIKVKKLNQIKKSFTPICLHRIKRQFCLLTDNDNINMVDKILNYRTGEKIENVNRCGCMWDVCDLCSFYKHIECSGCRLYW